MITLLAQSTETLGNPLNGVGTWGNRAPESSASMFELILSNIIGIMTVIAIIWFVFVLITGAISWISSGGDKQALEGARKRIFNGLIGLVIIIVAIFLIGLVGSFVGLPDILKISDLINKLAI
jgi:NADH:ubiquinone oxidoreductase subunit 6 (subunit J)